MALFSREPAPTREERARRMEMEHAERMKLIETGQPLPEVAVDRAKAAAAEAQAEVTRATVCVVFGALGPASIFGIGIGATSLVLNSASPTLHLPVLLTLWVLMTLVCLAMVAATWPAMLRPNVKQLLAERLPRPAARKPEPRPVEREPQQVLEPGDLTPQEREKLSRAIQQ